MQGPERPWELVADLLAKEGWSLGWAQYSDGQGQTIWQADANRGGVHLAAEGKTIGQAIGELYRITRGSQEALDKS